MGVWKGRSLLLMHVCSIQLWLECTKKKDAWIHAYTYFDASKSEISSLKHYHCLICSNSPEILQSVHKFRVLSSCHVSKQLQLCSSMSAGHKHSHFRWGLVSSDLHIWETLSPNQLAQCFLAFSAVASPKTTNICSTCLMRRDIQPNVLMHNLVKEHAALACCFQHGRDD